jgi:1-acyl-sn-glycerol-3-phosphate acyltransferase
MARDWAQRFFFALVVRPFLRLFIGVRVRGHEHLPASDPFILVANHSSHLDAASLLSLFPLARLHRIQPVAAADYFGRSRPLAWFTRTFFNILPIARRNFTPENDPRAHMLAALRAGRSLIIFPEGTRGAGTLGHFKRGVAHLVEQMPEVPVVPAYLANLGRSLPKGEWVPVPFIAEIRLGPPRTLRGTQDEIAAALEAAVRELGAAG